MVEFNIALLLFVITICYCEPVRLGFALVLVEFADHLEGWALEMKAKQERDRRTGPGRHRPRSPQGR